MQESKKTVRKFLTEYNLYDEPFTVEKLEEIIKKQGFEVVYFDALDMSEKVKYLANRLNLHDQCQSREGFTYCQKDVRLVFIKQTLNEEDKISTLLHEEIHIYLDHFYRQGFRETSTKQEGEVHKFEHMIQQEMKWYQTKYTIRIIVPAVLSLLLIVLLVFRERPSDKSEHLIGSAIFTTAQIDSLYPDTSESDTTHEPESTSDPDLTVDTTPITTFESDSRTKSTPDTHTYYWTQSGTVYHMYIDCSHLKNSTNIQSGSIDQSNKGRCCKTCYARYLEETYGN